MAKKEEKKPLVDPWSILEYPLLTEKSLGRVEIEEQRPDPSQRDELTFHPYSIHVN